MTLKLTTPFSEKFAPRVNYGGRPFWCAIEYRAEPSPATLEVRLAPKSDNPTRRWFPHVRDTILELATQEAEPVEFTLEVLRIHEHPIDTDARACRAFATMLFRTLLERCERT